MPQRPYYFNEASPSASERYFHSRLAQRSVPSSHGSADCSFNAGHPILIEIFDMPDGTSCCAVWTEKGAPAKLYCPC